MNWTLQLRQNSSLLGAVSGDYQWFKRLSWAKVNLRLYLFLSFYLYTSKKMRFTTISFLTCALMASTIIAKNCLKGSYYCGSELLKIGPLTWYHDRASILSLINYYQEITAAKSSKPCVVRVNLKPITTSIIRVFTASITTPATSILINSVQRVVTVRVTTLNRKSVSPALYKSL